MVYSLVKFYNLILVSTVVPNYLYTNKSINKTWIFFLVYRVFVDKKIPQTQHFGNYNVNKPTIKQW